MTKVTNDAFDCLMGLETADVDVGGKTFTLPSLVPADVQKASKNATKRGILDDAAFKNNILLFL